MSDKAWLVVEEKVVSLVLALEEGGREAALRREGGYFGEEYKYVGLFIGNIF